MRPSNWIFAYNLCHIAYKFHQMEYCLYSTPTIWLKLILCIVYPDYKTQPRLNKWQSKLTKNVYKKSNKHLIVIRLTYIYENSK